MTSSFVPLTLLQMVKASLTPPRWDRATLLIIDAQRVYLDGAIPLTGMDDAVAEAADVLAQARAAGAPVIHIVHRSGGDSPFAPTNPQTRIIDALAPQGEEVVVEKTFANGFTETTLAAELAPWRARGRDELVVVGFMTHNCVSSTVRGARDLGYRCTVVASACATRPLPDPTRPGAIISAEELHRASLAGLFDTHGPVVATAADLRADRC